VGKEMNEPKTNKPKEVIWDMEERERLLTGATVVKVTWDTLILEKDGKRIVIEADCYQCGYGRFIVRVRE
jgi:selenophosphate synthetase-related protein